MEFVPIPAGSFWMGCSEGDEECRVSEEPRRQVRLSRPFELGKYEVTQQQWQAVMGDNPSIFHGARRPVEHVSWHEVQEFLSKLNARQDGYRYRLPTEAEWEYAARAGTSGKYYGDLDAIAWHADNTEPGTHDVGKKQPNAWGLFDILGNVSEWCQDWYALDYYKRSEDADPQGPSSGTMRIIRGGAWYEKPWFLSVSFRDSMVPEERHSRVGFRCLRERK
jgi:formylglycine-generating enzyme required for sulfatase activity